MSGAAQRIIRNILAVVEDLLKMRQYDEIIRNRRATRQIPKEA
jgi:hypothetical protein